MVWDPTLQFIDIVIVNLYKKLLPYYAYLKVKLLYTIIFVIHNHYTIKLALHFYNLEVNCGPLQIQSGEVIYDHNKRIPGTKAVFHCIEGHKMKGFSLRVCSESGQWTGTSPVCCKFLK